MRRFTDLHKQNNLDLINESNVRANDYELLHFACLKKRYLIMRHIINTFVIDMNLLSCRWSCKRYSNYVIKYLVDNGYECRSRNNLMFKVVAARGNIVLFRHLLEECITDPDERRKIVEKELYHMLKTCIMNDHIEIIKYLSQYVNRIDWEKRLHGRIIKNIETIKVFKICDYALLKLACKNNELDIVKHIFEGEESGLSDEVKRDYLHHNCYELLKDSLQHRRMIMHKYLTNKLSELDGY